MQQRSYRHRPSLIRLFALVITSFVLVSMSVAAPLASAPALATPAVSAAAVPATGPIAVPACTGTTSSSYGTVNTPAGFTFAENSSGAQELRAGKTVMLYGNQGDVYVDGAGNNTSNGQGGLPYCGARVLDDGELEVDWRFCTDQHKLGCADQSPSPEWSGNPDHPLTAEQKLQIANVLINAPLSKKRERAITQLQVWCISDDWAEGSVNTDAKSYFNYNNFQGSESVSDLELRALSNDEARCNYLPDLAQNPTLTLTGPSEQLQAGSPAQFTLTTNITTPITLSSTGASALQLCPSAQNGVTFDGAVLQLSEPGVATLCANSTSSADVAVTADTGDLPQAAELNLLWNGDNSCQVFADYVEGAKLRLTESANASFIGSGTFAVSKAFDGVTPTEGDLDDVTVELSYVVTGGPALPAGTPSSGRLVLNQANGFTATGPTYLDGTTVHIDETSITGLPQALQQDGVSWTVDGQTATGPGVDITIGDGSTVAIALTDTLNEVLGTFEVRKSFSFENGSTTPPAGVEVEVRWWLQGNDESTAETILLTDANGFAAMPGADPASPTLFPIGATILMEEVPQTLQPGIANVIDWGSNTDPSYQGTGNRGIVTISQEWDPAAHNPGGDTPAAEVQLTNGIAIDRGSLTIRKQVADQNGGAQPEIGEGAFDDMEILVSVSWAHPDPQINVSGSNVLLLNAGNNWTAGLGVDLPVGTVVTSEETVIASVDPSIEWDTVPLWSCGNCTPSFSDVPGAEQSLTITGTQTGQPVDDVALVITNVYRVMTGSFSVEKIVAGDISRDDDRLAGMEFTAEWTSTDVQQQAGQLVMSAPDWTAVATDTAGDPVQFPLGTEVTLSEVTPPVIPGVVWEDDVMWSIGDEGADASFTIIDEDLNAEPAASITLTNFVELHEGTFSVAKFVNSIAPTDTSDVAFEVSYRSPGEDPAYAGTLTVRNDEEAFSGAFPAGTELLLDEVAPEALPGTDGWRAPQFVNSAGENLDTPVLITIGDGTDVRVDLVNTTIEPDEPEPTTPSPTDPTDPTGPTDHGLAQTGADGLSAVIWLASAAVLLLAGAISVLAARRRHQSSAQ